MAKKNSREPREKTKGIDLMEPINITQFGTDDDPCFGKEYNLSTPECKRCGDSELCAIVMGQNNHIKRKTIEDNNRFKDLEIVNKTNTALEEWVKKKMEEGLKRSEIITKAKNTYGSSREEIKSIYAKFKK